ncbi:MAG: hypothetical protein PHV34_03045 [Verrucomicrobiae bacterium]|nr:hypothetical protein [Verrucomicrobiae bacterium]
MNSPDIQSKKPTSRRIAWFFVILGLSWSVWVSPKTPVEFFDAAVRDANILTKRDMELFNKIDPAKAADVRKIEEMNSLRARMERISLVHDWLNHPKYVREQRSDIVWGFYTAHSGTETVLLAKNPEYLSLSEKFETLKTEVKSRKLLKAASSLSHELEKDPRRKTDDFRIQMQRFLLREFQARIFWWGNNP